MRETTLVAILCWLGFVLPSLAQQPPATPQAKALPEEYAVYAAVLHHAGSEPYPPYKLFLIGDVSIDSIEAKYPVSRVTNSVKWSEVEREAVFAAYRQCLGQKVELKKEFLISEEYELLDVKEAKKLFFEAHEDTPDKTKLSRRRYAEAKAVISFSRVGFNPAKTKAIVFRTMFCGGLCGNGAFYLLQKEDGVWKVLKMVGCWES